MRLVSREEVIKVLVSEIDIFTKIYNEGSDIIARVKNAPTQAQVMGVIPYLTFLVSKYGNTSGGYTQFLNFLFYLMCEYSKEGEPISILNEQFIEESFRSLENSYSEIIESYQKQIRELENKQRTENNNERRNEIRRKIDELKRKKSQIETYQNDLKKVKQIYFDSDDKAELIKNIIERNSQVPIMLAVIVSKILTDNNPLIRKIFEKNLTIILEEMKKLYGGIFKEKSRS